MKTRLAAPVRIFIERCICQQATPLWPGHGGELVAQHQKDLFHAKVVEPLPGQRSAHSVTEHNISKFERCAPNAVAKGAPRDGKNRLALRSARVLLPTAPLFDKTVRTAS